MVVVVLLVALWADLQQCCQWLGITCVEWESWRLPDEASIVLVTPELVVTGDFFQFLNQQRLVQQLGKLLEVETQMVLLMATLPPVDEALLCSWLHC